MLQTDEVIDKRFYISADYVDLGVVRKRNGQRCGSVSVMKNLFGFIPIRLRVFLSSESLTRLAEHLMLMVKVIQEAEDA